MKEYKMIACDLDGTLIGSDTKLSDENHIAIKELTEMGVWIVPATGRTLCEMEEIYRLPEIRYVIYSNGAAVYDKQTDKTMFWGLDEAHSRFMYETLLQFDALAIIHKDGKSYADYEKSKNTDKYHLPLNVEHLVKNNCILDKKFEETFQSGGIECVAVFFADREEMQACRKQIAANLDLYVVDAWDYNLEIFYKDAGKGNALKVLAKTLDIDMENVISIGDSDNDRQMTLAAGLGLAARNGAASLKEVADDVICSNDEHVMCYVKERYFNR